MFWYRDTSGLGIGDFRVEFVKLSVRGLGTSGGGVRWRDCGLPVASNLALPAGEWERFRLGFEGSDGGILGSFMGFLWGAFGGI